MGTGSICGRSLLKQEQEEVLLCIRCGFILYVLCFVSDIRSTSFNKRAGKKLVPGVDPNQNEVVVVFAEELLVFFSYTNCTWHSYGDVYVRKCVLGVAVRCNGAAVVQKCS